MKYESVNAFIDTQTIRLIDVSVIGPILIFVALYYALPKIIKLILLIIGVATILYNLDNYVKNEKIELWKQQG